MEPSEPSFVEPIAFFRWFTDRDESYVRVRFVLLRLLALVYLVAFVVTVRPFR